MVGWDGCPGAFETPGGESATTAGPSGFLGKLGGADGNVTDGTCGILGAELGFGVGKGGSGGKLGGGVSFGCSGEVTAIPGPTLAFVVGKLGSAVITGIDGAPGRCRPSDTAVLIFDPKSGSTESTIPKHCVGSTHIRGVCRSMTVPLLHSHPLPAQVGGQA